VDPIDAQKLTVAQQTGKLSLILRGVNETDNTAELGSVGERDLPDQPELAPAPEPEKAAPTVRVRKGSEVSDVEVQ
jgi:Flp pilus assembly protein CpaB